MQVEFIEKLIANPPLLHFWGGQWNPGGFHESHIRAMISHLKATNDPSCLKIVETGAGQSTALFLAMGAAHVTSIAPDADLFGRIRALIDQGGVSASALDQHVAFSEDALPDLAKQHVGTFDVGLIDGGHGWPTVFVDFCYINKMLRSGGLLIVDDVQLYTAQQLFLLLSEQPGFEFLEQLNKLTFFRKTTDAHYLPDFGGQPFIMKQGEARLYERKAR